MGLNFQTCTIINSNLDPDSGKKLFEKVTEKIDGVSTTVLRIKRDFVFAKDNIVSVHSKAGYEAEMCKATIDFTTLIDSLKPVSGENFCRLDIYLEFEGQEPFYGANPMYIRKGIPFWVEFSVKSTDTAATVAEKISKTIKKNHLFLIDKDTIKVTVSGNTLVLEGVAEYMRFKKITISQFSEGDDYSEEVAVIGDSNITLNKSGKNSFGTYSQLIKDLRLPTAANYQWTHIRQVETPIVGAIYNQYIINYSAPASNEGTACVGQKLTSNTTHVFWVKNDSSLISEWEEALNVSGLSLTEDSGTSSEPGGGMQDYE